MKYNEIKSIADALVDDLSDHCEKIIVAGSIRRKKAEPRDIEIVCIPKTTTEPDGLFDTQEIRVPEFSRIVRSHNIIKGNPESGKYIQFEHKDRDVKVDLFTATKDNWGTILLIRTGDWHYSKYIMGTKLPRWGYHQRDGYVWRGDKIVPVSTEKALFKLFGSKYIRPEDRVI